MKKCKQHLSLTLALVILLSSLASCSESKNTENDESKSSSSSGNDAQIQSDTSGNGTNETEKLYPILPADLSFDGADVRIMQHPHRSGDWSDWLSRDLYAETYTGEPINDAVYERNAYVSEKYKVNLDIIDVSDMPGTIKKQSTSGTDDYHISTARVNSLPNVALGGYLMNLYDIQYIDLEKPWYDDRCIADASYYGLLYYVTGSMIILDDDSTGAMVFNKQLIKDLNLDSPYQMVLDGTWTFDKMKEYAQEAAHDLSGNGEVDIDGDRFGILWQRDAIVSFLHAGGSRIVQKDENGEPQFVIGDEHSVNVMDKLDSFMYDPTVAQNMHNYGNKYPDIYAGECAIFKNNNALFMWVRMRVVENLRDMEADFGIIPVPKYDEEQKDYYSTVNAYTAATICIPNSAALDLKLTGAVIEAMSAEGHYGLREAYYENNLGKKIARDPDSTEMLDIIMNNRVYDTGEIYGIGGLSGQLYALSSGKNGVGLATLIKKTKKAATKSLEKSFVKEMKKLAGIESEG